MTLDDFLIIPDPDNQEWNMLDPDTQLACIEAVQVCAIQAMFAELHAKCFGDGKSKPTKPTGRRAVKTHKTTSERGS